jgi:Zn-dependent protease with chaperone function
VSTGLIGALSDDAPLALMLAHEIAHHILGHVASAPQSQWRDCLGAASAFSALAAPAINRLLFSVEQEFAADREALNICHRAGFDLTRCLDLYRILSDWEETGRDIGVTFPGDRIGSSTGLQRWMRARYSGYPSLAARREAAEVERILIETANAVS